MFLSYNKGLDLLAPKHSGWFRDYSHAKGVIRPGHIEIVESGFVQTAGDILGGSFEFKDGTFWGLVTISDYSGSCFAQNTTKELVLEAVEKGNLVKHGKNNKYEYDVYVEYAPKLETPYKLHLYGTDDGDWWRFYHTLDDAQNDLRMLADRELTFTKITDVCRLRQF